MEELVVRWLRLTAARVTEERERLTALDAAIGDGDHGINLDRGFREVVRRLDDGRIPAHPPGLALEGAGRALVGTVGGASGALYGRGFQRAGAALLGPGGPAGDGSGAQGQHDGSSREARAIVAMTAAVDAVTALGRAVPGEKTMLDVLVPARDAFAAAVTGGADLAAAAARAAEAADAGALATVPLVATKGRASYLGERSVGHLDPGAASSALLLRALADVAAAG